MLPLLNASILRAEPIKPNPGPPNKVAIANGDRIKAIGLQAHIDFLCAAMVVICGERNLLLLSHLAGQSSSQPLYSIC